MSNAEHLEILKSEAKRWNEWRGESKVEYPDLRGANLRGADLRGANLRGANLYGANGETIKIFHAPVIIQGLHWTVIIAGNFMEIGCERHLVTDWAKFKESRIKLMDSQASKFWKENKESLLVLAQNHLKQHNKLAKDYAKQNKEATE